MTRLTRDPIKRSEGRGHQAALRHDQKSATSLEWEGLQTSNLVYGWSTMTCITEVYGNFDVKAVVGCSSHHLHGAGHIVAAALQATLLVHFAKL